MKVSRRLWGTKTAMLMVTLLVASLAGSTGALGIEATVFNPAGPSLTAVDYQPARIPMTVPDVATKTVAYPHQHVQAVTRVSRDQVTLEDLSARLNRSSENASGNSFESLRRMQYLSAERKAMNRFLTSR